jgi:hypothetical protein
VISHVHRCIFVHVPKTGGVSVEDVIWPGERDESQLWMGFVSEHSNKYQTGGLQHLLARQIREEVGARIFNSYFKFAFVRNPWDKAVSQFASMAQRPDLREFIGMSVDTTFDEYLHLIQRRAHVQWCKQVDFIRDENGAGMVDFIGRFETLRQDTQVVFDRIGVDCEELPHLNASEHRPYAEYFTDQTRESLHQLYREDIEAFGYQFSEPA